MRDRVLFAIACVLAIGAGLWLGVFKSGSDAGSGGYSEIFDERGQGDSDRAPELMGAGDERVHVPRDIRGRGSVQGTVRRTGDPVAARVELRHVAEIDPDKPFLGGMTPMMIERMLDAGISSKAVIAREAAGEDGQFHFRGLAPGLYEVRAWTEDGALGFASALLPADGARVEASIDVPAGGERLEGRVQYANGTAFQGIVVAAAGKEGFALMMGGHGNINPTPTDAEGRFAIGGLSPGAVRISAIVPGVLRYMAAPVTLPYAGEYLITIGEEGVDVKGKVVSAATQEPIAGATVFGGGGNPESSFTIRTTTSADDGTFTLAIPSGGNGGMFVKAEGYAPGMVNFRRAKTDNVTVSLHKLATVTGIVKSRDVGEPLAGVGVYAIPGSRMGGEGSFPAATVSDAGGRFTLSDVTPGSVKLFALGAGWVTEGAKSFGDYSPFSVAVEPGGSAELDIEVVPAGQASGVVRTSTGELVAGAVVTAAAGNEGMMLAVMMGAMGSAFGSTVTDAEGRFAVDSLFPGQNYVLTAKAPGLPEAKSKGFVAQGGQTHETELVFSAPRWLLLRVVDGDGGPIVGAQARVKPAGSRVVFDDFFGMSSWTTAPDGVVKVGPLPPDDVVVVVSADGYIEAEKPIDARGGGDVDLTVELEKGLVIAGRVEHPEGVAVRGVRVTIQTEHGFGGRRDWFHERRGVDEQGAFRVTTIKEPGAYKVRASAEWDGKRYKAETIVEAGTEDVVLTLARDKEAEKNQLVVNVLGPDGKPVPSGRIQLYQFRKSRGTHSNRRYVSEGKAEFDIDGEDAVLWIEIWEVAGNPSGAAIRGPFSADETEIEVRLEAPRSIEGAVVGPDGAAVRGVRVMAKPLHPAEGHKHGQDHGAGFSGKDGTFVVKGLGDLEYELHFDAPPDYAPPGIEKARGGARGVRVTLRQGVRATLTIVDYDGKPVPGASIHANPKRETTPGVVPSFGSSGRGSYQSDAEGTVRMRGLDPEGTFTLNVNPPEGRLDLRNHQADPWTPQDGTIVLDRAYTITGTVLSTTGEPVTDCWVQHRRVGEDRWKGGDRPGAKGAFVVKQLAAGRYELRARLRGVSGRGRPAPESVTVRAGASGVRLVVDLGASLTVRVAGWKELARGAPIRGMQATLRPEGGTRRGHINGRGDALGQFSFIGLEPDTRYTLWIGGLPGGHYVHKTGLRAGAATIDVRPEKGGSISGRVRFPDDFDPQWVSASAWNDQGMSVGTQVDQQTGRFELTGLPEGEWTVQVHAWADKKRYQGRSKARVGAEVELELKPQD